MKSKYIVLRVSHTDKEDYFIDWNTENLPKRFLKYACDDAVLFDKEQGFKTDYYVLKIEDLIECLE